MYYAIRQSTMYPTFLLVFESPFLKVKIILKSSYHTTDANLTKMIKQYRRGVQTGSVWGDSINFDKRFTPGFKDQSRTILDLNLTIIAFLKERYLHVIYKSLPENLFPV